MGENEEGVRLLYLGEGSNFAGVERYALTLMNNVSCSPGSTVFCGLFYGGRLKEELDAQGETVLQLYGNRNAKSFLHLLKYLRKNEIDILHLLDIKSTCIGGLVRLFNKKIRTVATIHGLPEYPRSVMRSAKYGIALTLYYLFLAFLVDRIICVSDDLAARLGRKVRKKRLCVIHNGVDRTNGNETQDREAKKMGFVVGTVGRLEHVKGLEYLLQAASTIARERRDIYFHIVGTGPLETELKEQVAMLGVEDRVFFLGFHDHVLPVMRDFDLFVLPSLHEGIPYALLEAMSLSKPVVCTRVGGIREIINNGVEGVLVPPADSEALSLAIRNLLHDAGLRARLGACARERIEREFTAGLMAERTGKIYAELLTQKQAEHHMAVM